MTVATPRKRQRLSAREWRKSDRIGETWQDRRGVRWMVFNLDRKSKRAGLHSPGRPDRWPTFSELVKDYTLIEAQP